MLELEGLKHKSKWSVSRFANEDDARVGKVYSDEEASVLFGAKQITEIDNNILVNTGINLVWTLVAGASGTKFDAANAYLGVGTSATAEDPAQTDLLGTPVRVAMMASFPTYGTSQQAVWQSSFDGSTANFHWQEFAVFNAGSSGTMLNRKVSDQGTKTSGQVWQLTLTITLS